MTSKILQFVRQRGDSDCAVACIASLCCVSYEEALVACATVAPAVLNAGMYINEIEQAVAVLGYPMRRIRIRRLGKHEYNVDEQPTGILNISAKAWTSDHTVILIDGYVYETDGSLWDADVFLQHHHAKPGILLVEHST